MATAIQFLRSAIPSLRPNPVTIEDGMPMVNTNEVEPGLFFRLRDDTLAKIGPTHVGSTAPNAAPQGFEGNSIGESWLDTSAGSAELKIWNGSEWVLSTSSARFGQSLIAGSGLSGLAFDGTADRTWSVDSSSNNEPNKVVTRDAAGNFSAGTITAALIGQSTGCTVSIEAGLGLSGGGQLTSNQSLAVSLANDTIEITSNGLRLNATDYAVWNRSGNYAITGLKARTAPTLASDPSDVVATKGYVDAAGGGGGGALAGSSLTLADGGTFFTATSTSVQSTNTFSVGSSDFSGPYTYLASNEIGLNADSTTPKFTVTADGGTFVGGAYTGSITTMAALDVDCSLGNYFKKQVNGNSTFTFSNVPSSVAYSFTLELDLQAGPVQWPASVYWPGDAAPTLDTSKFHLIMFATADGGTTWRASALANYSS